MKSLFLAWQDLHTREWTPIGKLCYDGEYIFFYTKGAQKSKSFTPPGTMDNINSVYKSKTLFPFFANRLLSKSRPEYKKYINWLNLNNSTAIDLEMLALTEGKRGTDNYELFPCPTPINGNYEMLFFSHGIRHLPDETIQRINKLQNNEQLFMMFDFQNTYDQHAIALRTTDPTILTGYVPRYLVNDFWQLIRNAKNSSKPLYAPHVVVQKVNPDAPSQFKMLCKISCPWPDNFKPCTDEAFEPIVAQSCELNDR